MDNQQHREIFEAARIAGGKDCHLITSIATFSVSRGMPIAEVLRQISKSRPELFHPTHNETSRQTRERRAQYRAPKTEK